MKKLIIKNSLQALWIEERTKWMNCTNDMQIKLVAKRNKLVRLYNELKGIHVILPVK